MIGSTLGDLSQSYSLRQRNLALKTDIARLTTELSTGQVADVRRVLDGNTGYLTDIERKMDILEGYSVATSEAALFSEAAQNALGRIQGIGTDLSGSLLLAGTSAIGTSGSDTVAEAKNALAAIMGTLNTDVAGRHMFSGTATDQPPLGDPDALLTGLRTALITAGAVTPADLMATAELWFDDPAGFAATAYQGSDDPLAPFALSQTEDVALDLRATDPRLREVIKLTALAALADDPAFGLGIPGQSELFDLAGQQMLNAQDDLTGLRAAIGFSEQRIEQISSRNAAEVSGLEFARTRLLEIDPFEAATKLEDVQFQLQSLYSVTVRNAQLSLVNFL